MRVGTLVVAQAGTLTKKLPDMLSNFEHLSPRLPAAINDVKAKIASSLRNAWDNRSDEFTKSMPAAGMKFLSVASNLIYVVMVPVLAFFFLKDGEAIRRYVLKNVVSGAMRGVAESVMSDVHILLAQYMRALVVLSLATFVAYTVFFSLLQMPFSVLLAVVAMLLEFIPIIGPATAVAIILVVTLVSGAPLWAVALFLAAYRLFQDYLLSPQLMAQGMAMHPLLVMLGVFGGAEVAGVAGSFLSVPVLATARILYIRSRRSLVAAGTPAEESAAQTEAGESPLLTP